MLLLGRVTVAINRNMLNTNEYMRKQSKKKTIFMAKLHPLAGLEEGKKVVNEERKKEVNKVSDCLQPTFSCFFEIKKFKTFPCFVFRC